MNNNLLPNQYGLYILDVESHVRHSFHKVWVRRIGIVTLPLDAKWIALVNAAGRQGIFQMNIPLKFHQYGNRSP
ncbi:MAG: hypothetical protein ABJP33_00555 [Pseudoruegeria sp.]